MPGTRPNPLRSPEFLSLFACFVLLIIMYSLVIQRDWPASTTPLHYNPWLRPDAFMPLNLAQARPVFFKGQIPIADNARLPERSSQPVLSIALPIDMDIASASALLNARCRELEARMIERHETIEKYRQLTRRSLWVPSPSDYYYMLSVHIDARAKARILTEVLKATTNHSISGISIACRKRFGSPADFLAFNLPSSADFEDPVKITWHVTLSISLTDPAYRIEERPDMDCSYPADNSTEVRTLPELLTTLRQIARTHRGNLLVLNPNDSVTVQQLVDVWDAALSAGFQRVTMMNPEANRSGDAADKPAKVVPPPAKPLDTSTAEPVVPPAKPVEAPPAVAPAAAKPDKDNNVTKEPAEFWSKAGSQPQQLPVAGDIGVVLEFKSAPSHGGPVAVKLEDIQVYLKNALSGRAGRPANQAMLADGRVFWLKDTFKVKVVEVAGAYSQITIIDGPDPDFKGRTGWLPTAWIKLDEPIDPAPAQP